MIVPFRLAEFTGGLEAGDGAAFVTTAPLVLAMASIYRLGCGGDLGDGPKQARLVAFDLNDQGDAGLPGDLEVFF